MNEPISLGVMPALARYAREAALNAAVVRDDDDEGEEPRW
jgi:hypothetical protein